MGIAPILFIVAAVLMVAAMGLAVWGEWHD
jgi:hypothetical protein